MKIEERVPGGVREVPLSDDLRPGLGDEILRAWKVPLPHPTSPQILLDLRSMIYLLGSQDRADA